MNPKRSVYHHPGLHFVALAKRLVFLIGAVMNDSVYHQIQSLTQPYLLLQMSCVRAKGADRSVYQQIVSLELHVDTYKRQCGDGICPQAKSTRFCNDVWALCFTGRVAAFLVVPGGMPHAFETSYV